MFKSSLATPIFRVHICDKKKKAMTHAKKKEEKRKKEKMSCTQIETSPWKI
jgi:hypothetical protein